MKHMVHRGQGDVLIHAAIASYVMSVEHFVVVGSVIATRIHASRVSDGRVIIRLENAACRYGNCRMGDIVKEGMSGKNCTGCVYGT
jgi:hypothetical protein